MDSIVQLLCTVNARGFVLVASILCFLDTIITFGIIQKVPYTEIDWSTYMQQVQHFVKNELNYTRITGDTGPVVYPAGHLMMFRIFHSLTDSGKDLRIAQYIFMFVYLLNLVLVFRLYHKSNREKRLISSLHFLESHSFSFAVSTKMNVLLFAPALFFIFLLNIGVRRTIFCLFICATVQLYMGLPFLLFDWKAYLMRSFDLQRVFLFKWTVNWRFLPESFFLDRRFHFFLLFCHLISLTAFGYYVWFRSHGGLRASLIELLQGGIRTRTGVAETMFALFTSNLIGISFSRSLHYQFYSWYFHQLPFLLFWNFPSNVDKFEKIPSKSIFVRALLLLAIELCWNVYPSTVWSSFLLHLCHMTLLCLCLPIPQLRPRSRTREHREYMISQRFCQRFLASTSSQPYKVFDRNLKRKQRDWAVKQPDFAKAQYLKEEVGWRIADKVFDLTKFNPLVLDIGCGSGHISPHLIKENVGKIIQCDISEAMVTKSASNDETEIERLVCDEETLEPFRDEQFDLLLSSLSAHWINDLPGWFRRCYSILKPDCPLIGAVFTEDTLYELRCSLQLAESECQQKPKS
ncbi:hypothetical protein WR25_27173 [Diploscapter pachys]|uniref:dolichyl-P-Man:Man5GlcNAc2-PP-dolichol alpha-1,3-mannosyltransferase n=1 Tax=Diploscapter pachys TaxID=2018661 RepID=A0A2A2LX28_9BILA|nr:hypothetical protein WR25_27173 [Diploscapter pachys]